MANLAGLTVARNQKAGYPIRELGVNNSPKPMTVYGSVEMHSSIQKAIELGVIPPDRQAVFRAALNQGTKVPVIISPDDLHIFVAGGVPGAAFSFNYPHVPPYCQTAILTKKITGATLTKAGATG